MCLKMPYNYKTLQKGKDLFISFQYFLKHEGFAENIQENINNRCMYMFIPNSKQESVQNFFLPHPENFLLIDWAWV